MSTFSADTYALISPTGKLVFCAESPRRMLEDAAVGDNRPHEFTIISPSTASPGLHGCITSVDRPVAPPNEVAAAMITALGGPDHDHWLGILGICGTRLGNPTRAIELCGLIAAQKRLIHAIHSLSRNKR